MTTQPNKLTVEECEILAKGGFIDYPKSYAQVVTQLADTMRELAIYKGWEEGKQLIINQLEAENKRLRSILQDYLSQQEGCPPSTIMNRMQAELNRNKPTVAIDPSIPSGEAHFKDKDGKLLGKITDICTKT